MSKREELAKAYLQEKWSCAGTISDILRAKTKRNLWWGEKAEAFRYVDAILAALAEPSEEMLQAGRQALRDFGMAPAFTDGGGPSQPPLMHEALRKAFPEMLKAIQKPS